MKRRLRAGLFSRIQPDAAQKIREARIGAQRVIDRVDFEFEKGKLRSWRAFSNQAKDPSLSPRAAQIQAENAKIQRRGFSAAASATCYVESYSPRLGGRVRNSYLLMAAISSGK